MAYMLLPLQYTLTPQISSNKMDITFLKDDCRYELKDRKRIREWLREVALREGEYKIDCVNYVFTSSEKQLQLNRQFLGHDFFTDIITFDYSSKKEGLIAGEIYIDVDTVKDNAKIYGTEFKNEILRVIVHGVLHLCGQTDKTPRKEKQMHQKEDKYLKLYFENCLENK